MDVLHVIHQFPPESVGGSESYAFDVAQRQQAPQLRAAPAVVQSGSTAVLGGGGWGWWTRIGTVVPLVALVAGLITISVMQDEDRASELAEVDSALLTGDLPPAAYTDPGFAQFLKSDGASD